MFQRENYRQFIWEDNSFERVIPQSIQGLIQPLFLFRFPGIGTTRWESEFRESLISRRRSNGETQYLYLYIYCQSFENSGMPRSAVKQTFSRGLFYPRKIRWPRDEIAKPKLRRKSIFHGVSNLKLYGVKVTLWRQELMEVTLKFLSPLTTFHRTFLFQHSRNEFCLSWKLRDNKIRQNE